MGIKSEINAVIKFTGTPSRPDGADEPTKWKRFLRVIWPWAKKSGAFFGTAKEITEAYYRAEVKKKEAEAEKFAAEAANHAAEADLKKQEKVKLVNDEVARIFNDPNTPDMAKQLQFASLLSTNPEIVEQLKTIRELVATMRAVNLTEFRMDIDTRKSLAIPPAEIDEAEIKRPEAKGEEPFIDTTY